MDQALDWRESERADKRILLDLRTSSSTQGESRIYGMLEILEPTVGPLELFLVWGTAEDLESLLDCLHVGHIVVRFKEGE